MLQTSVEIVKPGRHRQAGVGHLGQARRPCRRADPSWCGCRRPCRCRRNRRASGFRLWLGLAASLSLPFNDSVDRLLSRCTVVCSAVPFSACFVSLWRDLRDVRDRPQHACRARSRQQAPSLAVAQLQDPPPSRGHSIEELVDRAVQRRQLHASPREPRRSPAKPARSVRTSCSTTRSTSACSAGSFERPACTAVEPTASCSSRAENPS